MQPNVTGTRALPEIRQMITMPSTPRVRSRSSLACEWTKRGTLKQRNSGVPVKVNCDPRSNRSVPRAFRAGIALVLRAGRYGAVDRRPRRPAIGTLRPFEDFRSARLCLLHESREPKGAGARCESARVVVLLLGAHREASAHRRNR